MRNGPAGAPPIGLGGWLSPMARDPLLVVFVGWSMVVTCLLFLGYGGNAGLQTARAEIDENNRWLETTLRYEQPAAPLHFHVHPGRAHPAVLLSPRCFLAQ